MDLKFIIKHNCDRSCFFSREFIRNSKRISCHCKPFSSDDSMSSIYLSKSAISKEQDLENRSLHSLIQRLLNENRFYIECSSHYQKTGDLIKAKVMQQYLKRNLILVSQLLKKSDDQILCNNSE